ncbi:MAG: NAD(P)H-binding protein [Streptosporangiales bacterium]|nr:NAD(P)H-binding protein [Streptosporangiales bacterium]
MRTAVFGATGGVGSQLVEQATNAGREVTAVVRDASKLAARPGLTVVPADVMQPAAIAPAIADSDAVVSALGSRGMRTPSSICTDGATSIVRAMHDTGVHRLVVVSASGLAHGGDGPLVRLLVKPILGAVLKHPFADMRAMEDVVRDSGLDWTIVRPPQLTDGPRTGTYHSRVALNVRGSYRISRADVADCLLRCLTQHGPIGAPVSIAS